MNYKQVENFGFLYLRFIISYIYIQTTLIQAKTIIRMNRFFAILLLMITNLTHAQNCNCDTLFLQTQIIVENNYAGWFDKVNTNNRASYKELTAQYHTLSKNIKTDSSCAKQLQEWVSFFNDKHLKIKFTQPKVPQNTATEIKDISILTTSLTESQIMEYFLKSKKQIQ